MNTTKLIPLLSIEFILFLILGFFSIKLIDNIDLIFNTKNVLNDLIIFLIIVLLISVLGGLLVGVIKNIKYIILTGFILSLGYLLSTFVLSSFTNTSFFIQYTLFTIGLIISFTHLNSEMTHSIDFKIGRLTTNSFKTFFILFAISLSSLFYMFNSTITMNQILTDSLLNKLVDPITVKAEKKINEEITNKMNNQLQTLNINIDKNANSLLPLVTNEIRKSIVNNYGENINTKNIGVIYNSNNKEFKVTGLSTVMKPIIKKTILKYATPYEKYLSSILTVLFYLTIVSLLSISRVFIRPLAWLIEEILLKLGYIKKELETIEVERISL